MPQPHSDASATIIAFAPLATGARRPRDRPDDDGTRGTILLFTGIRYERLDDERREPPLWSGWDEGHTEIA